MRWTDDVRDSLAGLDGSPAALRRFGLLVGAVLAALGGWLLWRGHAAGALPLVAGALLALGGWLDPSRLAGIRRWWMALAFAVGWLTSRAVLTVVFLLVVTPLGLTARLLGRRLVERRPDRAAASYWEARPPGRRIDYLKLH
jgi:hypothetical protein